MHDSMMTQGGMEHEHHQTQENNGYGSSEGWVDMSHNYNTSQHQSPFLEQGPFVYSIPQSGSHGMTMEPAYSPRMIHPLPPSLSHQQLLPLNTNHSTMHSAMHPTLQPTWPSQLTNPSYSSPPIAISAVPAPLVKGHGKQSPASPTPRKTLTDADRRRMCQYNADNPTVKQTEIGAMFGVERSTVSKVLRNKDKYLFPDDQTLSPVKRAKGKFPDVERALSIWVKNQSKAGVPLTDSSILERARVFSAPGDTPGDSRYSQKFNSPVWLQKFKQKTGIHGGKLTRRASETNISDRNAATLKRRGSHAPSASQTPNEISPSSPNLLASPSPLSGTKSEDEFKPDSLNSYFSLNNGRSRYVHSNSQSATSLSSNFTDHGATSPTAPFAFSPDNNSAPWQPSLHLRQPTAGNAFQRPRSQTFPMLGLDPSFISTHSNEPLTPKYSLPVTAPSSALDSPMNEMAPPFGIDSAISSPHLHHSSSNGSMGPPPSGTPTLTGLQSPPGSSAANSPTTQDDARKALDTILIFIQQSPSGLVDQNEYLTILKLTEKLTEKLHIQQTTSILPRGLHRIAEQDFEVAPKMEHSMSAGY